MHLNKQISLHSTLLCLISIRYLREQSDNPVVQALYIKDPSSKQVKVLIMSALITSKQHGRKFSGNTIWPRCMVRFIENKTCLTSVLEKGLVRLKSFNSGSFSQLSKYKKISCISFKEEGQIKLCKKFAACLIRSSVPSMFTPPHPKRKNSIPPPFTIQNPMKIVSVTISFK